jgi:hypothetical protein
VSTGVNHIETIPLVELKSNMTLNVDWKAKDADLVDRIRGSSQSLENYQLLEGGYTYAYL